jgi:ABC-type branched-subunit amino acid transport system substrate-binding protein
LVADRTLLRAAAVVGALGVVLAGCSSGSDASSGSTSSSATASTGKFVYGVDGNMGNALGEGLPAGLLAGMKGTTPLTDTGKDFQDRLLGVNPGLVDFNYSGESYDAAVISALAAVQAKSTAGTGIAANINSITVGGQKCTSYQECLPLAKAGTDLQYVGVTGALSFNDAGEPTVGSYGVLKFNDQNKTEDPTFTVVGDPANPVPLSCTPEKATAGAAVTTPLRIGTLLPATGSLAFLGPPEVAGVQLAVNDINAAGGVLDQPVQIDQGDSGDTTTDTASQTVDRELAAGDQVIIGAASSSVSLKVIDKIATAGSVMFSPANTSDQFSCYADKGQYFRTAPADLLQAQAQAQLITADGNQRVSMLALNDPYGTGLSDNIRKNLVSAGIPDDQIQTVIYDPNAQSFNAEVDQVKQFNPDGIVVIGFDESKKILTRMAEVGIGPSASK